MRPPTTNPPSGRRRVGQAIRSRCSARRALQSAIFSSANFSSIRHRRDGVIQIFNVGAERMLGYAAIDSDEQGHPADISDPQEVIARAERRGVEPWNSQPTAPGFEPWCKSRRRAGFRISGPADLLPQGRQPVPAVVSVTALRDAQDAIIGYLLIGTDNTARKQVEDERAAARPAAARSAFLHALLDRIQHRRADGDRSRGVHHRMSTSRPRRSPAVRATTLIGRRSRTTSPIRCRPRRASTGCWRKGSHQLRGSPRSPRQLGTGGVLQRVHVLRSAPQPARRMFASARDMTELEGVRARSSRTSSWKTRAA